jgi:hypothetical protein
MFMYILMFLAVYLLRTKTRERAFKIPGGRFGLGFVSLLGLIGAGMTILFGFIPPDNVNIGSSLRYTVMIAAGNFLLILPVLFFIYYRKKRNS